MVIHSGEIPSQPILSFKESSEAYAREHPEMMSLANAPGNYTDALLPLQGLPKTEREIEATIQNRVASATEDLQKLYALFSPELLQHAPTHILEIGPGMGGVTIAIQERFPNTSITGIDRGKEAFIAHKALENNVELLVRDLLSLDKDELVKIIREKNIDQIIGLRTSGGVAHYLGTILAAIDFQGPFIFSLGVDDEGSYATLLRKPLQNMKSAVLQRSRSGDISEIGYVLFPENNSTI